LLRLRNVAQGTPFITAVYYWRPVEPALLLTADQPMPGDYASVPTAACPWRRNFIEPDATVLDAIAGISRAIDLPPEQSPCLALTSQAWDEPRLRSACPSTWPRGVAWTCFSPGGSNARTPGVIRA
jgi:hypothetical protein